ncbi:hypothetical protein P8V03_09080 [Clostridium sp. A1-XYC3]|uniref:Uncharacterized protein n=1 Tax=Clostridium tanneri TaxID=3037988 RepID=A0ABU4JTN3_9CLOT|nr:hypothetical protein [Clostridium sp. A1-XYC3]MDW8801306.1 hypothetical protein [Clostridium sp. A1-XYC3]
MANSVTLAGYTITFIDAVCNSNNTQTWRYAVSITTTSPPGGEISNWVLQLCSNPVQDVVSFSAPAGITAETGTFRSCLSNTVPPPPITTFNGIKYNGVNNNNVTGIYTFTINGCFQQADVNVAVKTGGGDPSPETCFIGVITGPSCTLITPTTAAPTTAAPTTAAPTTAAPTTAAPTTAAPTTAAPTTAAPTTAAPTTAAPTTAAPTTAAPTTAAPTTAAPTTAAPTPTPCPCCFVNQKSVVYADCELEKSEAFDNITLNCTGRFLDVNVTLVNVCPNKHVSIGVLVYDDQKRLISIKVCRLFTGDGPNCIPSLNAGKFCFVFDDDPCPPPRTFTVRIVANYLELTRD